jgi:hypothetical protein
MSTKKLTIGSQTFEYPIVGSSNYGEEATAWAEAATAVLAEVKGPGDISITESILTGTSSGGFTTGLISGLQFDTSFVQRVSITGLITRKYTEVSGKPQEVESFTIEGAYNAVEFNFSQVFAGDMIPLPKSHRPQCKSIVFNGKEYMFVPIKLILCKFDS